MILTKENYHSLEANKEYVGTSQFKSFLECEAKALAEVRGDYKRSDSSSLLQGQYFDTFFEEEDERMLFEIKHNILSSTGKNKGNPKAEYQKAIEAYNRVKEDPVLFALCSGEQQKILTGEIQGVPVKIMIDSYLDDLTVDRKFMKDFEDMWVDGEKLPFAFGWGYNYQAAFYQTIRAQNEDKTVPFALAAITKQPVPDVGVFLFRQETIDTALAEIKARLQHIQALKNGEIEPSNCGKCDYCKSIKQISADREEWVLL